MQRLCHKYFFSIIIVHVHPQYVSHVPARYLRNVLKTLGEIDFTVCTIEHYSSLYLCDIDPRIRISQKSLTVLIYRVIERQL